ncbi:MAG: MBL fold metallo-hydrolase [Anaerolineae bacterium]|nr:MBL fold metallo-hydrolase [Anaerolineae bacterium]
MIERIQWLGHGSFRIEGPPLIYINPWRLARNAFHADVVLVSSDQYDHFSPADIDKLRGPDTLVVTNAITAAQLGGKTMVLRPWQSLNIGTTRITAIPAYTFSNDYPVSKDGLGFIVSIDYFDIYYAGSTDVVPELSHVEADIAILPVGGAHGTMNLERTVDFVQNIKASCVIPSHWGTLDGTHVDVQALSRALTGQAKVVQFEKVR